MLVWYKATRLGRFAFRNSKSFKPRCLKRLESLDGLETIVSVKSIGVVDEGSTAGFGYREMYTVVIQRI